MEQDNPQKTEEAPSLSPLMSRRFSLRRNIRAQLSGKFDLLDGSPPQRSLGHSSQSLSNSSMSADHGSDIEGEPCVHDASLPFILTEDQASDPNYPIVRKPRSRMSSSSSTRTRKSSKVLKTPQARSFNCQSSKKQPESKTRSLFDVSKCEDEPERLIERDPFLLVKFVRPSTSAIAISESQKEQREASLCFSPPR